MTKEKDNEVKTIDKSTEHKSMKHKTADIEPEATYKLKIIFKGLCLIVPGAKAAEPDTYQGITVLLPLIDFSVRVSTRNNKLHPNDEISDIISPYLDAHIPSLRDTKGLSINFDKKNKHDLRINVGGETLGGDVKFYTKVDANTHPSDSYPLQHIINMEELYGKSLKVKPGYSTNPFTSSFPFPKDLAARVKIGGTTTTTAELGAYSKSSPLFGQEIYYFRTIDNGHEWIPKTEIIDGVIFTLSLSNPNVEIKSGDNVLGAYILSANETLTINIKNEPTRPQHAHYNNRSTGDPIEDNYPIDYDFLLLYELANLGGQYARIPRVDPSTVSKMQQENTQRIEVTERIERIEKIEKICQIEKITEIVTTLKETNIVRESLELNNRDKESIAAKPMICNLAIFSGE